MSGDNNKNGMETSNQKKIVKFNGGLGNQMFQFACALALSKKFNTEITMDFSWFEEVKTHINVTPREFEMNVFNLDYQMATLEDLSKVIKTDKRLLLEKFLGNILKINKFKSLKNRYLQKFAHEYDKKVFESDEYLLYEGYFQNEKYFKHLRKELLEMYQIKSEIDEQNQRVLDEIKSKNSISLHVRRGDYLTLDGAKRCHGVCPLKYYQKAVKYIAKKVTDPHFYIFSDDIPWVIENLKPEYPYTVVDFNSNKGFLDMNLMKNCKHNIIANSSFSWWGAWLNENPSKIVIAPKKWLCEKQKDSIIPKNWIKF